MPGTRGRDQYIFSIISHPVTEFSDGSKKIVDFWFVHLFFVLLECDLAGLKLNIQKTKITASGPITSRQIEGEKVETVTDFTLLGSKITADSDCSYEVKRCLFLGRKAMTNLDSVLKKQ